MKNVNWILIAVLALLFAACSPNYYLPNTQNVPMLTDQGQVAITACGNGNQGELQAAYAAGEHLGMMLNTAYYFPRDNDNGDGGSGGMGELGVGYTTMIGENLVFDAYGLAGFGGLENHFPSTISSYPNSDGNIRANAFRFGIQPSFGFKSEYFSAAVSSRFQSLNYGNIQGGLVYEGQNQASYLNANKSLLQVEPAFTVRAGLPRLKLQAQYLASFNLTNPDFRQDKSLLTLGIHLQLN